MTEMISVPVEQLRAVLDAGETPKCGGQGQMSIMCCALCRQDGVYRKDHDPDCPRAALLALMENRS